jgi:hypothetical protein
MRRRKADEETSISMTYGSSELAERLISQSQQGGGWPGRSYQPSVTVTSEAILALIEYLEQLPLPNTEQNRNTIAEINNLIDRSMKKVISLVAAKGDLDVPNSMLSLAAYCAYRVHSIRAGFDEEDINHAFLSKTINHLKDSPTSESWEIGKVWAYIKGIDLFNRSITSKVDTKIESALTSPVDFLSFLKLSSSSLRKAVLSKYINDPLDSYSAAVVMDISFSTIYLDGVDEISKSEAVKCLRKALQHVLNDLRDFKVGEVFPGRKFDPPSNGDGYRVVTRATLLANLGKLIDSDVVRLSHGEKQRLRIVFYCMVDGLPNLLNVSNLKPFDVSHCLRSLSEAQINARDARSVMEFLIESQNHVVSDQDAYDFAQEIRSGNVIKFGEAKENFLAVTPAVYTRIMVPLLLTFLAQFFLIKFGYPGWALILAVVWLPILGLPIAFSVWANTQKYHSLSRAEKRVRLLHFIFTAAVPGLVMVAAVLSFFERLTDAFRAIP